MSKLDTETLFNLFKVGDEELYNDLDLTATLQNPFLLIGMTIYGVHNYFLINEIYENRFKKEYDSVKFSLKLEYFTTLVGYLERIKEYPSATVEQILHEFGKDSVYFALTEMINFFEEIEHYEKCSTIKKSLDNILT